MIYKKSNSRNEVASGTEKYFVRVSKEFFYI